MSIQTSVPVSTRRPGTFFEFNIANAARGLVPLERRIVLVGMQGAAATKTALEVNQVFSEADADLFYEQSSELALMAKFALRSGKRFGVSAEVWAIGIAAPTGVAATNTFTVSGTATASGEVILGIAGRTIRAPVANGDSDATVAAAIDSAIQEQEVDLPVTTGVVAAVVTITHLTTGVNGNDVVAETLDDSVSGITVAAAVGVAGTGAYDITTALDNLGDKDYDLVAIGNHESTDVADLASHLDDMFDPGTKRWRHTIMAETGTLSTAQALATAADNFRQMVVTAEGFRNTPAEIAAYVGMPIASEPDPALPFNSVTLPDLTLPDPADIPTNAEIESAIGGGLLMLSANEQQTQALIVRGVTTQVTLSSSPFFVMLDVTISKSMFFTARQVDSALKVAFPRAKKSGRTKRRVRSVVLQRLKAVEEQEIIQNVDALAGELLVEDNPTNPDRLDVAIPTSVVPPLNQIVNVINLLVE
jgi:phage tail sheath gpL-like